MKKILLRGPQGERWIEEGKPFRFFPGEVVVENPDGQSVIAQDESEKDLYVGLHNEGIQWGDAVAKLTKVFGIQPCSKCEQRRRILNEAKKLGVKETLAKLRETI